MEWGKKHCLQIGIIIIRITIIINEWGETRKYERRVR